MIESARDLDVCVFRKLREQVRRRAISPVTAFFWLFTLGSKQAENQNAIS